MQRSLIEADLVKQSDSELVEVGVAMPIPDLYRIKHGNQLKMMRIMEGGACKNAREGVIGMFMLYANSEQVERLNMATGPAIFAEFEQLLEEIAMDALSHSVTELDFSLENPFALEQDESAQLLAEDLIRLFERNVTDGITAFEQENGLMVDIVPLLDSLYFYRQGCELPEEE